LDSPPRLIIDLPNAELSVRRKRIEIRSGDIKAVRLAQYRMNPPVVQVIVELVKPEGYTWEAAGNRLIVRLQEPGLEESGFQRARLEARGEGGRPVLLPKTVQPDLVPTILVPTTLVPASLLNPDRWVLVDSLAPGASVTAGTDSKFLYLRNGELDICPGTTVSVTRSRDRSQMMLAINTGALETHYVRENSEDSILTPDFRILLHGLGEFH
jgi:AMIN domain